jgi:protein-tyrosine phosphatase
MITKVHRDLYRGPHLDDLDGLKRMGITKILSLQTGLQVFFRGKVYAEDEAAEVAGIKLVHVTLDLLRAPSSDQIAHCMVEIGDELQAGGRVYVHCKDGVDRTGFIIASWRVLENRWTKAYAIEEWFKMGFHGRFYFCWPDAFLKRMKEFGK